MLTFVRPTRVVIAIAAIIAATTLLVGASQTYAAFNVSDPLPGQIRLFAVDSEPSGNTATSVVDVDTTRQAAVGASFDVDLVVDEIALQNKLEGWDMDFHYNPSILRVTGFNAHLMLAADPGSVLFDGSNVPPDSDGDFYSGVVDISQGNEEIGEGVLARLTLECLAPGTSTLFVDYVLVSDPDPWIYYDANPSVVDLQPIPIITNQGASVTCLVPAPPNPAVGGAVSLNVGPDSDAVSLAWYIVPAFALAAAGVSVITARRLTTRRIK